MKNIYVGNLSYDATEDQVRSMFEQYGAVDRVSIVTDRDTGQPRGFAFVEMTDDDSASKAMDALNGMNLGGRNLTVNEARPKGDRPRGGGGGGGGRGGFGGGGGGRGGGGGGRGRSGGVVVVAAGVATKHPSTSRLKCRSVLLRHFSLPSAAPKRESDRL